MKPASLALAIAIATVACGVPAQPALVATFKHHQQRGSLVAVEPLGMMGRKELLAISAELPGGITVRQGVYLFRVTYWTALKGKPIKASGLFVVPQDLARPKGVMMYLHGTNNTRALSPSQPDRADGNQEAAIFGGNGYYVVLPDYIGLGVSHEVHPYLITKPLVDDSIDLLRAVRQIAIDRKLAWSSNLFMIGFSQGGQVVAGIHRELERSPLPGYRLKGSIGVAGPYELRKTSLPKAIERECLKCVGYLAWGAYAYADYYGHDLNEALKPAYADRVSGLFNGSKTIEEIGAALPAKAEDMFQSEFLKALRTNGDNWFTKAMDRNETYRWVPRAPFQLYFGEQDRDVTPDASKAFFDYAKPRGGNIRYRSLGAVDHQTSMSLTYAEALHWFDKLAPVN